MSTSPSWLHRFGTWMSPPSRGLAIIALSLWLTSLCLPAIAGYGETAVFGSEILLLGFLGKNFAWLSNWFFLFAATRLIARRPSSPLPAALIAAVLAVDTVRLNEFWLDEGGSTTIVYGYAAGAILWFAAIATVCGAAAQRTAELNDGPQPSQRWLKGLRSLFISAAIAIVLGSFTLGLVQRSSASTDEIRELRHVAFKRAPVCTTERYTPPTGPIVPNGPIEVIGELPATPQLWGIMLRPLDVLLLGVPTVRTGGLDYYVESDGKHSEIRARYTTGQPSARLKLAGDNKQLTISIRNIKTDEVIQEWRWNRRLGACPELHNPEDIQNLLRAALVRPGSDIPPDVSTFYYFHDPQDFRARVANIWDQSFSIQWPQLVRPLDALPELSSGCSPSHGPVLSGEGGRSVPSRLGDAFAWDGNIRFRTSPLVPYPEASKRYALCVDGDVYLAGRSTRYTYEDGLEFTKLSLSTLEQPWGVYVPLPKFLFFEEIQGILLEERTVEVFLSRVLRPGLDQSPFVGVVIPRPDIQTKE